MWDIPLLIFAYALFRGPKLRKFQDSSPSPERPSGPLPRSASPPNLDLYTATPGLGFEGFWGFRVLRLQGFRVCRVVGFQGFRVCRVLGFLGFQGFWVSGFVGLQGFRVCRVSGF